MRFGTTRDYRIEAQIQPTAMSVAEAAAASELANETPAS